MKIDIKAGFIFFKEKFLKTNRWIKLLFLSACLVSFVFVFTFIWYQWSVSPISKDKTNIKVYISLGSGSEKIAKILKNNDVIKSESAFKLYVRLNNISGLKAGTYYLNKSMSIPAIVSNLKTGIVFDTNSFNATFIEGKTMRWLASKIADVTNNTEDDVFELLNDEDYINNLVKEYWFLTEEIKKDSIYYPLEGYLFPDTYNLRNKNVNVQEIFKVMLDQTEKKLEKYKENVLSSKYSIHELFTLASIVEMEGVNDSDRSMIASVFYNRLNLGMPLGSDVTTYYAFKIELNERDLYLRELTTYNPYNTRGPNMDGKLPIGPISSISEASLLATIFPAKTDFIYFVADKNKKVYFTRTFSEHSAKVLELKSSGNWFEY